MASGLLDNRDCGVEAEFESVGTKVAILGTLFSRAGPGTRATVGRADPQYSYGKPDPAFSVDCNGDM